MINYLERALENLEEALDSLEEQTELLDGLKNEGVNPTELEELEAVVKEKTMAIRYLLKKCNSIMEGNFEVVDLLKQ